MRIEAPVTPWDEPPHPGVFRAPLAFVDVANEGRLIRDLRGRAKIQDPSVVLAHAATEFFKAGRARTPGDRKAAIDLGTAIADLAVTGRKTYSRFQNGVNTAAVEGNTRLRLDAEPVPPTDAEIQAAMDQALDRAFAVAWALRAPAAQRTALRARLGWIAVSAEDDTPHRPVNMPAPPHEQHEVRVRTPVAGGEIALWTRYFVASAEEVPVAQTAVLRRTAPNDLVPNIPADHDVLLFLHGHSSGAEEALDIIPHLLEQGLKHGRKLSVISFDLPNNGYSETFDHTQVAPTNATTFPYLTTDTTPIATPILDFIEDFVVAFVDAVEDVTILNGTPRIKDRIAAVFGGSLGGNLGLRLGRRKNMPPWLNRAIVAWSPASVWKAMVKYESTREGPRVSRDSSNEPETDNSRQTYFVDVYEKEQLPLVLKQQSAYWYRKGLPTMGLHIALSRIARHEIYNAFYRRWHWRVACEQLIYSHAENEVYGDSSTPVRCELNTVRTLLAAGEEDNYTFTGIYNATKTVAGKMRRAPGHLLLVRGTGHSIHIERPQYFAAEILKFLTAKVMEIRCVTRRAGRIERVGGFDHTNQVQFDMTQQQCIADISNGDEFYVMGPDESVAAVVVGSRRVEPGGLGEVRHFIKTEADDSEPNNLLSLPSC